jgi:hypothetical protein
MSHGFGQFPGSTLLRNAFLESVLQEMHGDPLHKQIALQKPLSMDHLHVQLLCSEEHHPLQVP